MKYKINLLPPKTESILDRMLYFSLHYLRYILVATQIVVIAVFFSKFKVDQQIVDLRESIGQKKEILAVSQPLLDEAKAADYKISSIKTILKSQNDFNSLFGYLTSIFPDKFFLTSFSIESQSVTLKGTSADIQTVQAFLTRLNSDKKFKTVNLTSLKKSERGLEFVFELSQFKS